MATIFGEIVHHIFVGHRDQALKEAVSKKLQVF
jgi:hypothetical protein